jgi:hypothetical protein
MKKTTEDFCETAKRVLERLTEIVLDKDYDGSQGRRFLTLFFAEDRALFHRFMGFLNPELKMSGLPKSAMVDILTEAATAAASLGWDEGYSKARGIFYEGARGEA